MNRHRLLSPRISVCGLVLLAGAVVAGLAWVSVASLRVETAQREAARRADIINKERRALWRLDSSMLTPLALENNRPYAHYFALHSPTALVLNDTGDNNNESVRVPSPLLSAELPDWMALHVQLDPDRGWESPQVIPPTLAARLQTDPLELSITNCTDDRQRLLQRLRLQLPAPAVLNSLIEQDRIDPDLNPYVVPVPLLDEPGTEKPRGAISAEPLGELRDSYPHEAPTEMKPSDPIARKQDYSAGEKRSYAVEAAEGINKEQAKAASAPSAIQAEKFNTPGTPSVIANSQQSQAFNGGGNGYGNQQQAPAPSRSNGRVTNMTEIASDAEARKDLVAKSLGSRGGYEIQSKNSLTLNGGNVTNTTVAASTSNNPSLFDPAALREPLASIYALECLQNERAGSLASMAVTPMIPQGIFTTGPRISMATVPGVFTPDTSFAYSHFGERASAEAFPWTRFNSQSSPTRLDLASRKPHVMLLNSPVASENKSAPAVAPVAVQLGPMRPRWLKGDDGAAVLCLLRSVRLESKTVYQGVVLDWANMQASLKAQVADLYPHAAFEPMPDLEEPTAERTMTALPVLFVPGDEPAPFSDAWSPLRSGLVIAWAAALLSIVAVAFGGRAILAMSERRVRFASAVTHELRTPLTAMQLHLDLLNSGLITDEAKKGEYLATIGAEADRLNRLVENVLDFARLEKKSAQANARSVPGEEILDNARRTWADRLGREGFELVVHSTAPPGAAVQIDPRVLEQVLGNLIDNARKYAKHAEDHRIWVWVKPAGTKMLALEVEDRGPGVSAGERKAIFRPFQRGTSSVDSGGAGLGLALSRQWIELFGGTISCQPAPGGIGSCFRIELPMG